MTIVDILHHDVHSLLTFTGTSVACYTRAREHLKILVWAASHVAPYIPRALDSFERSTYLARSIVSRIVAMGTAADKTTMLLARLTTITPRSPRLQSRIDSLVSADNHLRLCFREEGATLLAHTQFAIQALAKLARCPKRHLESHPRAGKLSCTSAGEASTCDCPPASIIRTVLSTARKASGISVALEVAAGDTPTPDVIRDVYEVLIRAERMIRPTSEWALPADHAYWEIYAHMYRP
jgi:hypothetical protein